MEGHVVLVGGPYDARSFSDIDDRTETLLLPVPREINAVLISGIKPHPLAQAIYKRTQPWQFKYQGK